jgi:AMIN domain
MKSKTLALLALGLTVPSAAFALSKADVISAEAVKRNVYVSDSVISGGDALADPMNLTAVRWAKNPAGYERIVVDLTGESSGWQKKTPPYFQVGHDSRTSSVNLSIRGIARREVNASNLSKSLTKSALIAKAYIAPGMEGDLASIEFQTRAPVDVESFYLTNPPRIVIDVRSKR